MLKIFSVIKTCTHNIYDKVPPGETEIGERKGLENGDFNLDFYFRNKYDNILTIVDSDRVTHVVVIEFRYFKN